MILLLCGVVVAACGGTSDADRVARERERQAERLAREAGLDEDVQRFLGRAAAVVGHRFRVTYDVGGEQSGTTDVFQDPPRRRVDVDVEGAPDVREITTGRRSFRCTNAGAGWTCRRGSAPALPGAFAAGDVSGTVDALRAARRDYTFRVVSRRLLGVEAECLVTELRPGSAGATGLGRRGTLCNSDEGVPLLVETPSQSIRALRYSTSFPGDAFDLPTSGG